MYTNQPQQMPAQQASPPQTAYGYDPRGNPQQTSYAQQPPVQQSGQQMYTQQPQQQRNSQDYKDRISPIIAKCATTGRFLDFQSALVKPSVNTYAQMHGMDYKDYGIRLCITNYTKDRQTNKAASSTVCKATCGPEVIAAVLEVCKKNIGMPKHFIASGIESLIVGTMFRVRNFHEAFITLADKAMRMVIAPMVAGKMKDNPLSKLGSIIKNDFLPLLKMNPDQVPNVADVSSYVDYDYSQTHVNTYRMDQRTGMCPVSTLHIWRSGRMPDGSVAKLPWRVNIQEFSAKQKPGALTAFDPSTTTDKKEVWIQVSDDDMFRCCYKVEHFVSLWELAIGTPYVRFAEGKREEERAQRQNRYEEIPQ